MVQLQPSLTLNLKNLASHGAVISAEQQVGPGGILSRDMLRSIQGMRNKPGYCACCPRPFAAHQANRGRPEDADALG
eukprot:1159030-Pelagomonas_calceolata.AAC.5